MAERTPREGAFGPADDFERRLLAELAAKELHFPKAILLPVEDPGGAPGFPGREWLASLVQRLPPVLLSPAFAYAVVLALLVPAYLGLSGLRARRAPSAEPARVPVPAPTLAPAPAGELGAPRAVHLGGGEVRGDASAIRVSVSPSDDYVILSFLAPTRSDPRVVYEAVLTDAGGRTVAVKRPLRSTDGRGSYSLVCASALLAEGDYVLSVSQVPAGPAADGPYRFPFRVVHPSP